MSGKFIVRGAVVALGILSGFTNVAAAATGVRPMQLGDKIHTGQGGPDGVGPMLQLQETVPAGDPQFRALFQSWKRLDQVASGAIAVPSTKPVNLATFTSGYGVRSDPFRRSAAMHAGIDLAAPLGTAIYATADGIVDHAEWSGGYGNMVEIDHGKGLQTRFGHLSRMLVRPGQAVKRGQLIALMGSTGRSTGSHLHYEVRIDGKAVNPIPFIQSSDYVVAMESRAMDTQLGQGGPDGD